MLNKYKNVEWPYIYKLIFSNTTYINFEESVKVIKRDLLKNLIEIKNSGKKIIAYGAAAKGMTLLNASNIHLDCVIDDNPLKQGLYCPGTTIPVVSIGWLAGLKDPREKVVFIPLAWNFYAEIKRKILAVRNNSNDVFLRYFPTIKTESNETGTTT